MPQNNAKHRLLIISYTFPPYPGIGGRRWAKFAKKLKGKGFSVEVFAAVIPKKAESPWVDDIESYKDSIDFFPSSYPKQLTEYPKSFLSKIAYRYSLLKVKVKSKGNYYDRSLFWKSALIKKTREFLKKEQYDVIIASGAPFGYLASLALLKDDFPQVKFVVDFRDPWVGNDTSYGWSSLNLKRQSIELENEKIVVEKFDKIISVSQHILDQIKRRHPNKKISSFEVLPNGYDLDDLKHVIHGESKKEIIKIVFAGSFYPTAEKYLDQFIIGYSNYLEISKERNISFQFDFYGSFSESIKSKLSVIPAVTCHYNVSLDKIHQVFADSDYALLFVTDDINYSISTKFCEYVLHNLPIIIFGKRGFTMNFVEENMLGWGIESSDNWVAVLDKLEKLRLSNEYFQMETNSISHLNLDFLTQRLIDEILN